MENSGQNDSIRPVRAALLIAGCFLLVSVVYVVFSDWLAVSMTENRTTLRRAQTIKGVMYVTLVAVGLYALCWWLLTRMRRQVREIQEKREALLETERRMMAGTLAASIAHDISNLLGAVKGNLQYALTSEEVDEGLREALEDSDEAVGALLKLNRRLHRSATRRTEESLEEVELDRIVNRAFEMIRTHSWLADCEVETDIESVRASVYSDLLTHAVINLVLNAAEATGGAGRIRICLHEADENIELDIEDDGPGIRKEEQERLLQPFETSKRSGSGLGLFSVGYCARRHRGSLEIKESTLGGAKMRLEFPKAQPEGALDDAQSLRPES